MLSETTYCAFKGARRALCGARRHGPAPSAPEIRRSCFPSTARDGCSAKSLDTTTTCYAVQKRAMNDRRTAHGALDLGQCRRAHFCCVIQTQSLAEVEPTTYALHRADR